MTNGALDPLGVEVLDRRKGCARTPPVGVGLDRRVARGSSSQDHACGLRGRHPLLTQVLEPANRADVMVTKQPVGRVAALRRRNPVAALPRTQRGGGHTRHFRDGLNSVFAPATGHLDRPSIKTTPTRLSKVGSDNTGRIVQTLNTQEIRSAELGEAGDPSKPHAVVIGSGFGGLAAAIRLGARGYRVTVLERRDKPGGRAYVSSRTASCSTAARR